MEKLFENLPTAFVLGYFLNQFLKRLDGNIEKVGDLDKRLLALEIKDNLKAEAAKKAP